MELEAVQPCARHDGNAAPASNPGRFLHTPPVSDTDWYRQVLGAVVDCAIITLNPQGRITMWSAGAEKVLGWSEAEMLGQPLSVIFPDAETARDLDVELLKVQSIGHGSSNGWRLRKSGEAIWATAGLSPIYGEDRALIGYVKLLRDMTQERDMRLKAEAKEAEAFSHAERVQLALAAGAIIGTWVWDLETDSFTIDDQFATSFGVDAAKGRSGIPLAQIIETVHPDDVGGLTAAIDEAVARGGTYAHQYRVRRADGRYYWIEANGRVERSPDGRSIRFPGVLLDIEQRRLVEEERNRALGLLRTIMEAVPGVVYAKDRAGRLLLANAGTTALIGKPPEDYIGKTDLEVLEDKDQARAVMATDRRIMESGESEQVEEAVRLADGNPAVWFSTKAPLRDDRGEIIGLIGASVDITARIRAEESLRELNETLEHRVERAIAEREKAEEALRQAQKMEAVGQLTGGIAHDFNNLLMIVIGNLEMTARTLRKEGITNPRIERAIEHASIGAERAAALTQRLLAFSRRQPLAPTTIDLAQLIGGMSDMLRRSLGEMISVEVNLPDHLRHVEADANQLESAILNLAVNGRDAMNGEGRLLIEAANVHIDACASQSVGALPPGDYVTIAVTDTGEGIAPELISRVIEPFFTTKEQGRGTGLGLSMVYGFARQSGGLLKIHSQKDHGTTVKIYLPQSKNAGEDAERDGPGVPGMQAPVDATILVAEDDDDVRAYTAECLRELGYRVLEAHNASTALRQLEEPGRHVDLLLTDVIMPGGTGKELADAALKMRPDLPVIYMSGYPREAIVHDGRLDDGVELLSKPFSYSALAEKLRSMLKA